MATFVDASRSPWREVARLCHNAAMFLDGSAAEQLHWAGGVRLLGDCVGAYDLYRDLSPVARDFIAMVSARSQTRLRPESPFPSACRLRTATW